MKGRGFGFEVLRYRKGLYCCFWHTPIADRATTLSISSRMGSVLLSSIGTNEVSTLLSTLRRLSSKHIRGDGYRLIDGVVRLPSHSTLVRAETGPHIVIHEEIEEGVVHIFSTEPSELKKSYVLWTPPLLSQMSDVESFVRQNEVEGYLVGYVKKFDSVIVANEESTLLVPRTLWGGLRRVLSMSS